MPPGYWSHLTQTQNPSCKAILEEQLAAFCSDSDDETLPQHSGFQISEVEDNSRLTTPVPFGGDIFGSAADYSDDNLGQMDVDEIEDSNNDEEAHQNDEDANQREMDHELETSWEPPRSNFNQGDDGDFRGAAVDEDTEHSNVTFDSAARLSAEKRVDECSPRIIRYSSRYPQSRVGAVVSSVRHTDMQYSTTLGSDTNPWAPFTSEIDWKVARWAKLRGPGSTAFSELLAIEGVSESSFFVSDMAKVCRRSLRH